jgi:hypothetical protein
MNSSCPCRQVFNTRSVIKCATCNFSQHKDCVRDCLKMINYECPGCQIKISDPYLKNIVNILTPTLIPPSNILKSTFEIAPEVNKIINQIQPNNNSKFLILRCLRLDSNGYEHHWPMNCTISINGKHLKTLSYPKEMNRSSQRKDFPLVFYFRDEDYTENYHKFHAQHMHKLIDALQFNKPNSLEIKNEVSKNPKDVWSYVLSIDLVEVLKDVSEVISKIPVMNDVEALKKRHNYLSNVKNELQILNEKVSFLDNYTVSGKRIALPVRSINCHHLKVFDLKSFLLLRRNKSYDCPFCKRKAVRLYIDGFIYDQMKRFVNKDGIIMNSDYTLKDESGSNLAESTMQSTPVKDNSSNEIKFNETKNSVIRKNKFPHKNDEAIDLTEEDCDNINRVAGLNEINTYNIVKKEFKEKSSSKNPEMPLSNKNTKLNKAPTVISLLDDEETNINEDRYSKNNQSNNNNNQTIGSPLKATNTTTNINSNWSIFNVRRTAPNSTATNHQISKTIQNSTIQSTNSNSNSNAESIKTLIRASNVDTNQDILSAFLISDQSFNKKTVQITTNSENCKNFL